MKRTTREERKRLTRRYEREKLGRELGEVLGIALGIAAFLPSCVTIELELKPGKKKDAQCEAVCHPHKSTRSGDVCFCLPRDAEAYKP